MQSFPPRPGVALRVITQASVAAPGAEVKAASGYDLSPRSGMISLDIPPGVIEPVPGGTTDPHVTMAYLGKSVDDDAFDEACQRAKQAAAQLPGPLTVSLSGAATFPPSGGSDGKQVAYIPASVPGGDRLRASLEDLSASEHPWTAHVTRAYQDPGDDPLPLHPHKVVEVTHLSVHRGDEVRRFPFGGVSQDRKGMDEPDGLETKVGPHGWSHNWVYHGIPGVGDEVHHPGHGQGKVTSVTDKHVTVQFASGANRTFEHAKPPAGGKTGFVTRAEHESGQRAAGRAAAASAAGAPHAAAMAKAKQVHEAEKARGAGQLHPLAKVAGSTTTDAKGTTRSTAVDHEGREFRLKANGDKVTVKHDGKSMSSAEPRNPTLKAREMAGKLVGTGAAPKAKEPDAGKPLAPGLSQSYVTGKGATDADVAELARRYRIMHGKDPSAKQLAGITRAKPEPAKPAAKPMPHHAATAHAIADDVRTERGLRPFQKEEAETRLRSAGRNLSAGNHDEAVADLGDATRAAGTPGGGVIKGSVAARSRDLAGKVRAEAGTAGPAKRELNGPAVHDELGKPQLTSDQKKAFDTYQDPTGAGFLNEHLHGTAHRGDSIAAEKQAAAMDSAFRQAKPTSKPMVVYRGMTVSGLSVGSTFTEKGYVSTSSAHEVADQYAEGKPVVRVHVPAGSKAISVAQMIGEDHHSPITSDGLGVTDEATGDEVEREVLLPRGSQFKVTGKSSKFIDVELVPTSAGKDAPANPSGSAPVDAAALHDAAGIATGPHPADRLTIASNPKATAKAMSADDLRAADTELSRRAALLGKPGEVSTLHKAIRGELASRLIKGKPAKVKAERKSLPSGEVTEVSRLLASATGREPAVRNHLSVATAALDQGDAKTAYGALDLARRYATGEFGDNPERPVLLADKTEAWRSITQLRDSLRAAARNAE